jgi:hypothetical protein
MNIENLVSSGFTADILGKKYSIKFQVRNFIALKKRFNIEAYDLVKQVLDSDLEAIIRMIWCGTLVFDDYDEADPIKIKEEIDLKKLYEVDYNEMRKIGIDIVKGLMASLPKDDTKKKTPIAEKKIIKMIKKILKIK